MTSSKGQSSNDVIKIRYVYEPQFLLLAWNRLQFWDPIDKKYQRSLYYAIPRPFLWPSTQLQGAQGWAKLIEYSLSTNCIVLHYSQAAVTIVFGLPPFTLRQLEFWTPRQLWTKLCMSTLSKETIASTSMLPQHCLIIDFEWWPNEIVTVSKLWLYFSYELIRLEWAISKEINANYSSVNLNFNF